MFFPSILNGLPAMDLIAENKIDETLQAKLKMLDHHIIVLDDDPTGIQTVHDISVYTEWSVQL